jgi:hypothetical protein
LTDVAFGVKALCAIDGWDVNGTEVAPSMHQPKVHISTIDEVLRAAEEAPALNETEVSKSEAMRRLVPALRAMQGKGYGLAQIARLLSDKGIAITEVALKHYMHRVGGRPAAGVPRVPKRDRASDRVGTGPAPIPGTGTRPNVHGTPTPVSTAERPDRKPPATGPARTNPEAPTAPAEVPRRGPESLGSEPPPLRAGFVVRPDRPRI